MKLCIALDNDSLDKNLYLAQELKGLDIWLKVGLRSLIRDSKKIIEKLKNMNFKIFLDLKLYDIPNTMVAASMEIAKLGVDMFNIHISAGEEGIKKVAENIKKLNVSIIGMVHRDMLMLSILKILE